MGNHLFDLLFARGARDATYIETPDGRERTFGDLMEESGRLANALVRLGVEPGDRVAVQVGKTPHALFLYLACLRCGAVYLPLNTAYTLAELDYFLGDAEPRLAVVSPEMATSLGPVAARHGAIVETLDENGDGTLVDRAAAETGEFEDVARSEDDIAAILYTSGTTGRSKGAMLTHGNLASNALVLCDAWRITETDRLIHALPLFHVHGLFVAINATIVAGASVWFLPKFDADQVVGLLARATLLMGVPTYYVRLLQHPDLTREAAAGMRLFISGSAPLLAETHAAFAKRTGHELLERYGMTETGMNTSNPYDGERIAGTVGFPLPGISVRVTDPATGRPLGTGETGMIEIKGPNVFKGYWRMPEKTAAEFRDDGFFISGDLGKFDAAGYLHIVGRGKDLIISGGYNIYPKEIETEIDAIDGVGESAVIGVAHPDFGEGVTAVVVRAPGGMISAEVIIDKLRDRLARFKQPKAIIFVDELPRNTMGKVQKGVLRDTYRDLYARQTAT